MLSAYYTVPYLLVMILACVISYFLTPLIRKSGISLFLAFVLSIIILAFWLKPGYWATCEFKEDVLNSIYGVLIGGGLLFLIGLISDIKRLSPPVEIIGQVASALLLASFGVGITIYGLPFDINFLLSVIWVILIINAFRMMNATSGLSEGIAVITAIPLFLIGWRNMDAPAVLLSCVLAGAAFGFMRYSFPPSKASLGKAGGMFLGFIIAAIAMAENYTQRNLIAFIIAPLFILAIPLYNVAVSVLQNKLSTARAKKQFIQHLTDIGFSAPEAIIVIYAVSFTLGIFALLVTFSSPTWAMALSFWIGALFIGLVYQLNQAPVETLKNYAIDIKKFIFFGGLNEPKPIKGISDIKESLRKDLRLALWLLTDVVLVNIGIYSGYLIRFDGVIDPEAFQPYLHLWYFMTLAHLAAFSVFKLYYHPKNFPKLEVITRSIKAVTLATFASISIVYIYRFTEGAFPSLVFVSGWLVNIILVGGWRVFIRYEN